MSLDEGKLTHIIRCSDGFSAGCPACQENGHDRSGNHLRVYSSGKYGCAVDRSAAHSSRIYALAGLGNAADPWAAPVPRPEPIEIEKTWPVETLEGLVKDHSYWVNRGIREDVLVNLRGGVATKGQLKDRYVIPIFRDKEIIGFTGRSIKNAEPRHKHLGKKSAWVFGGWDSIAAKRQAILVEGIGCYLALVSRGIPQVGVLWGVHLSEAVLGALIEANPDDIIISTNFESSGIGQNASLRIREVLNKFFDPGVVRIGLPLSKDFLEQTPAQQTEWEKRILRQERMSDSELDISIQSDSLFP
jgi:hypothetical protein